jgi:REP element-mobilizing transposase RayT
LEASKIEPEQDTHHRSSIRLRTYDYSQPGAYFVTICTHERQILFGNVIEEKMVMNRCGEIVLSCWGDIPDHYSTVTLDLFMVMPNHVHGIIVLTDVGAGFKPAPTKRRPVSEIVRAFKTFSARRINEYRNTAGIPVWQRNYYEHVIRSERELTQIREYISTNHLKWGLDRENPERTGISLLEKAWFR